MVRFGVIGSGWIAEEFVKGTQLIDGLEFAAMYSRTYEKGKAFAEKFADVPVYTDIYEFAASDIDAVYIASPNSLHYVQSKLMLENGKHVMCEKPITVTPEDFKELFELARSKNLIYTEAIMMLHLPAKNLLKNALKKIGKITTAHFDFSQLSSKYPALKRGENPNIFNPDMQTGCLRDLGIYCFYPAVEYFGMPDKITSAAGFVETGADGWGTAILDYPGMQVTLTYSKVGQSYLGSQIFGDKGTIVIESVSQFTNMYIVYSDGTREEIFGEISKPELMSFEAESFRKYIENFAENEEEFLKNSEEILKISELIFEVKTQCNIK